MTNSQLGLMEVPGSHSWTRVHCDLRPKLVRMPRALMMLTMLTPLP